MAAKNGLVEIDDQDISVETADAIADRLDFEPEDPSILADAIASETDIKRLFCGTFLFLIEKITMGRTRNDDPMLSFQTACQDPEEEGKRGFFVIAFPLRSGKGMSADQWRLLCRTVGYSAKTISDLTPTELDEAFLSREITLDVTAEYTKEYGKQNRFAVSAVQL